MMTRPHSSSLPAYLLAITAFALLGLIVLLVATATPAYGQQVPPNAVAQRITMIKELQESNKRLGEIAQLLTDIRAELRAKNAADAKRSVP